MMRLRLIIILLPVMTVLLTTGPAIQAADGQNRIFLNKAAISVKEGITRKIMIKNKPAGAKVVWRSKNKKIARVKKG